ncbi:MAG: hypothetical protein WDA47_06970 [Bacilli bacterium]
MNETENQDITVIRCLAQIEFGLSDIIEKFLTTFNDGRGLAAKAKLNWDIVALVTKLKPHYPHHDINLKYDGKETITITVSDKDNNISIDYGKSILPRKA